MRRGVKKVLLQKGYVFLDAGASLHSSCIGCQRTVVMFLQVSSYSVHFYVFLALHSVVLGRVVSVAQYICIVYVF